MIIGDLGSNGPLTFNGSQGSDTIDGDVNYNGTEITETGDNVYQNPDPVELPTVSEIADSMFTNGLTTLQTDNGNANIKMLFATDAALTSILTRDGITLDDLNLVESTHASALNTATKSYATGTNTSPLFDSAGFTTASRLLSDAKDPVVSGTATLDDVPSGTRFVTDEISVVDGEPIFGSAIEGIMGKRVYFIPPGDYYMHDLNLRLGNAAVVLLTHLGSIRFWVDEGGTSNQSDRLQTVVVFTSNDPSRFRLFYNKCQDLLIAGGSNFYGGFYAVRDGCSDDTPKLDFTGNTTVYGSVMASYLELGGGTRVIFPNDGAGSDPTDYSLWFGFKDQWREISPDGGDVVFLDNTSK
jgi:hypothetical protein